jgi:two-component system cell cycle sensor histidine kinase PleC
MHVAKTIYARFFSGYLLTWSSLALAAIVVSAVSLRLEALSHENSYTKAKAEAALEMLNLRRDMERVFIEQSLTLSKLTALLGAQPNINQNEFSSWIRQVPEVDRSAVTITASSDLGVSLVYPPFGSENFPGFDYYDSIKQLPGPVNTLGTGKDLLMGPVKLAQGEVAIIFCATVYIPGNYTRVNAPWGVVSIALNYQDFINNVGLSEAAVSYDFLIKFDVPGAEYDGQFFGDRHVFDNDPFFGDKAVIDSDPIVLKFDYPYGGLRLYATPKGGWATGAQSHWFEHTVILLTAVGLLLLLGYVMWLAETRKLAKVQLNNWINALSDGFVVFDANDRLVHSNTRFAEIYEFPKDLMKYGTPYSKFVESAVQRTQFLLDHEGVAKWVAHRMKARHAKISMDHEQYLADGRVMIASERPMPDGSCVGLRVDVTELSRAKTTAEAKSKAKTDFMNMLSHELRTPMTVVLGIARLAKNARLLKSSKLLFEAIERGDKSAEDVIALVDDMFTQVSDLMGRMIKSGDHMMALINGMLDFAAIEAGNLMVNPKACDITDIVDPFEQQFIVLSKAKGINFEATQDLGAVWADVVSLRQILFNLLGNAIKFTKTGTVRLTAKVEADKVVFEIHDSGPGMPKVELDSIFAPFYQVDSTATRAAGGTGMGLAISRNLAELNGGTLTVSSTLGQGSCFILTLPLAILPQNSDDIGVASSPS